jgi:hypothetical protein
MGKALTTLAMYEWFKLTPGARNEMKKLETYDFNIFSLRDETMDNELVSIIMIAMTKRDILGQVKHLDVEALQRFILLIQRGYKDISYHNKTHAGDVCQTFNFFCTGGGLTDICKFDHIDLMSYLVAACCHDYEHPGVSNVFLTQIRDGVALRHND